MPRGWKCAEPSALTPSVACRIDFLVARGFTDAEVGRALGVIENTIGEWRADPAFAAFIHRAKQKADAVVEHSLYERARGYTYHTQELRPDGTIVTLTKRMPPDVTACIFWLKNRQPRAWKDRLPDGALPGVNYHLTQIRVDANPDQLTSDILARLSRRAAPSANGR